MNKTTLFFASTISILFLSACALVEPPPEGVDLPEQEPNMSIVPPVETLFAADIPLAEGLVVDLEKRPEPEEGLGLSLADAIEVDVDDFGQTSAWQEEWLTQNACKNNGGYLQLLGEALLKWGEYYYEQKAALCKNESFVNYFFRADDLLESLPTPPEPPKA